MDVIRSTQVFEHLSFESVGMVLLEIVADITLVEFTETYIEFNYLATEPNYYINNEPFSRLQASFKITFSDAYDRLMDTLIVGNLFCIENELDYSYWDFTDSDVQAMVESFGRNQNNPSFSHMTHKIQTFHVVP